MVPLSYNLRSLGARRWTSLVTALGLGLVVCVIAASLMLQEGIRRTFGESGRSDTVIVLTKGNQAELSSNFEQRHKNLVLAAPGVAQDNSGEPIGVGEVVVVIIVPKLGTKEGYVSNVRVRGVPAAALDFRPEVKLIAGRPPRPGTSEVMIGQALRGRFAKLELGQSLDLRKNRPAKIVGVFSAGGSSYESEVWGDVNVIQSTFGRGTTLSSIRVRLAAESRFDQFKAHIESDKQLQLEATRETDYYEKQSEGTTMFIGGLAAFIAVFIGIGATIGAAITMHAAVAHRAREIGVLRALGFSRFAVLLSFVVEAVLLALGGAALGLLAALAIATLEFPMMNMSGWNEVVFRFAVTSRALLTAVVLGCGVALLGGIVPAVRAARIAPAHAVRN